MEERTTLTMDPMQGSIKEQAAGTLDQAKEQGSRMLSQAKEQFRSGVTTQKEQAAGNLESVAGAIRQSVDTLRTQQHPDAAGLLEGAAGAVENVSAYLREHDLQDVGRQVEDFGRKRPALFLGAAFVLGIAAARFLKSGTSGRPTGYTTRDGQYHWSGVYGERSYEQQFGERYYGGAPAGDVTHEGTGRYGGGPTAGDAEYGGEAGYDIDEAADEQSSRSTLS